MCEWFEYMYDKWLVELDFLVLLFVEFWWIGWLELLIRIGLMWFVDFWVDLVVYLLGIFSGWIEIFLDMVDVFVLLDCVGYFIWYELFEWLGGLWVVCYLLYLIVN